MFTKKLCLSIALVMSTLLLRAHEPKPALDLTKGDVLKCLLQSAENEGWKLIKAFYNSERKLVVIFVKNGKTKQYVSSR